MEKFSEKKLRIFLLLSVFSAGILVISNIVAVKLWDFFGIAVDGGIAIFPLTYIIGDIIVELYGKKRANFVIYLGFALNILAVLIFLLVGSLPEYNGWGLQESYDNILGMTPRIVIGSLIAYLISGVVNNFVFLKIKKRTGERLFFLRAYGSSVVAKIFDNVIFKTIAFYGVLSNEEFLAQLGFAYVASLVLELIMTPVSYFVVKKLKRYEIPDRKEIA